ncbi:MAG TPA: carbon-nitrogen family hydrolase [Acidimicrobiia bacterium]|nr:carbon-nitrogen family hydrolase [Acidimicrobiia bacterium]
MRVAAIQHDVVWEDPPATFELVAPLLAQAAAEGARLAVLTEMYATGFSMDTDRIAESPDGPSVGFLAEQAARHDMWVCGTVPERGASGELPANTLVLAAPGGKVFRYRKIHPFSYSGEHERYRAGDEFVTVDVEGVRCSLFVCYDLRFADEFWAVAPGTDCYVVPANWPAKRREHWRTLLRARAIENQAYVVGANRVGEGGGLEYMGDSAIIGPFGEELVDGGEIGEAVLVAEVDPAHVADVRARYPFLADRR